MTATVLPDDVAATGAGETEAQFKVFISNFRKALAEMGAPLVQYAGGVQNYSLAVSVAANALTIALKDGAGADPSATSPVSVPFGNPTLTTGDATVINVIAATSLVVSSGSTLGTTSGVGARLWVVGFNDAGTFRLGVVNCRSVANVIALNDDQVYSSTAEGGAGNADSAQVIYTGAAVASKAMRILGYIEITEATAGTYATGHTKVRLFGPGVPLPGQLVQVQRNATGAVATGTTTVPNDDTIPQNTEGDQYLSQAITPTSAVNVLAISSRINFFLNALGVLAMSLFQDATANALATVIQSDPIGSAPGNTGLEHWMLAGTTSSTTFKVRAGNSAAGTTTFNGSGGARKYGGVLASHLTVVEIMA